MQGLGTIGSGGTKFVCVLGDRNYFGSSGGVACSHERVLGRGNRSSIVILDIAVVIIIAATQH